MKDFEAMKTGKSAIRPWLIFPYKENILLDLLSSMACVVSCPNRTKNLECYLTFKCVHPLACSRTKPAGKLRRLMPSFGCILAVRLKKYFFRNKTFLFFKIESWTFQVQFEIKIRETSQNFNSLSLFRQLLFNFFFYPLYDWVETLWGFTILIFKQTLNIFAFYLEKQKSFIPKKIWSKP